MVILEELRKYQAAIAIWATVLRGISASDARFVDSLLELLDLGRPVPSTVVATAFDLQLRKLHNDKNVAGFCLLLAGKSDYLPKRLLDCLEPAFFKSQQVTSLMSFFLELLRPSDKLGEFLELLKGLSLHIASVQDEEFRDDLVILCKAATIQEAAEGDVAGISEKLHTLIAQTPDRPASKFQKALMFFSTGLAFVSRVESEVRVVSELQGLDIDLASVEKTLVVWRDSLTVVNEDAAIAAQVSRKNIGVLQVRACVCV